MEETAIENLAKETESALSDLYQFDRLLWTLMIGVLEDRGVLKKGGFAHVLENAAKLADEKGGQRSAEMLRGLVLMLSNPDAPPPPWKPKVIQGGKSD